MDYDLVVIGAGPVGLTFAASLAAANLRVAVIDRQPNAALAEPEFDGRDIAISRHTVDILERNRAWQHVPAQEIAPIRAARVIDGNSRYKLGFNAPRSGAQPLGRLVSNHVIRKAVFAAATAVPGVDILDDTAVDCVTPGAEKSMVQLAGGARLEAPLVVAADTRFSNTRRQAGISASMHDFGQTMIVARMAHSQSHSGISWECFLYGATLAVLPLNGNTSSIVLTFAHHEAQKWLAMDPAVYASMAAERLNHMLGDMELISERISYPLTGVYANRFVTDGFALIGDAAIGMHPVTAHGYNFGALGADNLARRIVAAANAGRDIRSPRLLNAYQAQHRRQTWPLYFGTQKLVELYTAETLQAKLARKAGLRAGNMFVPGKQAIIQLLTRRAA